MKTKVYQTREELKKIADETFRLMVAAEIKFPIKRNFHGLKKYIYEAQTKVIPVERRGTFTSTERREKLIEALNYRGRQRAARQIDMVAVTPAPVAAVATVAQAPIDSKQAVNDLGQIVGAFCSSDPDMMKTFINGFVTAFTFGMTGK